jgi:hypothetical protein
MYKSVTTLPLRELLMLKLDRRHQPAPRPVAALIIVLGALVGAMFALKGHHVAGSMWAAAPWLGLLSLMLKGRNQRRLACKS